MARTIREVEVATRYIGFCAMCEQHHKLTPAMKLVHHGYKRPGDGYIVGDCYCVHEDPYEVSAEPLHPYRRSLANELNDLKDMLESFESHKVTSFERRDWREKVQVTYALGVTPWETWVYEYGNKVGDIKHHIRVVDREFKRINDWIVNWKAAPIRTVEEDVAQKKAAAKERAKEREEKRALVKAKKAAHEAKQKALQERRAAETTEVLAEVRRLASVAQEGRDAGWRKAKEKVRRGLYKVWRYDFGKAIKAVNEEVVNIGLGAKRSHNGFDWVDYFFN